MRGAGTGRARPAKEAGWNCVGVLGSLSSTGDPTGLGWTRSGREGKATEEPTHRSLPPGARGLRPSSLSPGLRAPLGAAVDDDGHPKPHADARGLPSARPGPTHLSGSFLFLADLGGKALHSAHEQTGARRSPWAVQHGEAPEACAERLGLPLRGSQDGSSQWLWSWHLERPLRFFANSNLKECLFFPTPHLPKLPGNPTCLES